MLRSSPLFQLYLVRFAIFTGSRRASSGSTGFRPCWRSRWGSPFRIVRPQPVLVDLVQGPGGSQIKAHLLAHNAALDRDKQAGKPPANIPASRSTKHPPKRPSSG